MYVHVYPLTSGLWEFEGPAASQAQRGAGLPGVLAGGPAHAGLGLKAGAPKTM